MSAAATTQPSPTPPAADYATRAQHLLALIRKLIDYGRQLAATFQQPGPNTAPASHPRAFGTSNIRQILASILRGLYRAQELEARVVRAAARRDTYPTPSPAPSPRIPSITPATPSTAAPDLGPAPVPTLEQIAAEARRRPIGAVLADICRDLGILPSHPLWRELSSEIIRYGGNLAALFKDLSHRLFHQHLAAAAPSVPPIFAAPLATPATGPP
jgi:hypothetical protein